MERPPRTFSFVDRITHVEPGCRICGQYAIPTALPEFPASLVGEAIGQLAAWLAMDALHCSHRPVAGIAGRIEFLSQARPGQVLELAAEIESVDSDTVAYAGSACADGVPILRLMDCVGPMVPQEEFDDPVSMRERWRLLCATGAPPGAFCGLPDLQLHPTGGDPGKLAQATLQVPGTAPLFADHFPRRPVFPGTLLMHANLQLAGQLTAQVPVGPGLVWRPRAVSEVKLRTFISPGERLHLGARRTTWTENRLEVAVESRIDQRLVGNAMVHFTSETPL